MDQQEFDWRAKAAVDGVQDHFGGKKSGTASIVTVGRINEKGLVDTRIGINGERNLVITCIEGVLINVCENDHGANPQKLLQSIFKSVSGRMKVHEWAEELTDGLD